MVVGHKPVISDKYADRQLQVFPMLIVYKSPFKQDVCLWRLHLLYTAAAVLSKERKRSRKFPSSQKRYHSTAILQ